MINMGMTIEQSRTYDDLISHAKFLINIAKKHEENGFYEDALRYYKSAESEILNAYNYAREYNDNRQQKAYRAYCKTRVKCADVQDFLDSSKKIVLSGGRELD